MRHLLVVTALSLTLESTVLIAAPKTKPVSSQEAQGWTHYVVPLPKQIDITGKVSVAPRQVEVFMPDGADPVVTQAAKELREAYGRPPSLKLNKRAAFKITLQLGGPKAAGLDKLKNSEQAYHILPAAGGDGLDLVALKPAGLYYAAKTLQQLIRGRAASDRVEMPILKVTDWPDLQDRGLWGADCTDHLEWLADRKMNIVEQISNIGVDEQGRGWGKHKVGHDSMGSEAPLYAIKPVPVVLHLEQVSGKGVFKAYPELEGKGGQEGAICYSKPAIVGVLADWIESLASLPGVDEVDVWMTENLHGQGGCRCADCAKQNYSLLEARAIIAGWKKACERTGPIGLRVLTSEETEDSNQDVLRFLPPEVKLWYYHSLLTYNVAHPPMLRPYLKEFATQGRWIGVCPSLVTIHFAQPFTGADFIHNRMNEFVDKGLSGLLGYVTPRVYYARFNVEAAAEWSWNAKGRSPREFALSWAVRRDLKDPETFADFADAVSPLEWDIHGSHWPTGEPRSNPAPVAQRLRKGKLPALGESLWGIYRSPWGDIATVEQLEKDVTRADRAVKLAAAMGIPEFVHESLIAQGYIRSLKALWELKQIVTPEGVKPGDKQAARRWFELYVGGLEQAVENLPKWQATLPLRPAGEDFTSKPIATMRKSIDEMKQLAAELSVELNRR